MSRSRLVSFSAVAGSLVLLGSAAAAQRSANAPSILPDLSGTLGDNGWYVSDVTVRWNVSGETGTRDCDTRT